MTVGIFLLGDELLYLNIRTLHKIQCSGIRLEGSWFFNLEYCVGSEWRIQLFKN